MYMYILLDRAARRGRPGDDTNGNKDNATNTNSNNNNEY